MPRAEGQYACRDAGVAHGILQDQGPWVDSYGFFGSGANPRENTRCLPVDRSAMMPSGGGSYRNKFMVLKKH